jgi:phosphoenolpyruvate-protein kinase (PTS system EI component)
LTTIGKLSHGQIAREKLKGEYVTRAAARRLVEQMCEAVMETIRDRIPDYEQVVDQIAETLKKKVCVSTASTLLRSSLDHAKW